MGHHYTITGEVKPHFHDDNYYFCGFSFLSHEKMGTLKNNMLCLKPSPECCWIVGQLGATIAHALVCGGKRACSLICTIYMKGYSNQ